MKASILNNLPVLLLLVVTIIQWAVISYLIQERHQQHTDIAATAECITPFQQQQAKKEVRLAKVTAAEENHQQLPPPSLSKTTTTDTSTATQNENENKFSGVAVAIFFSAPAWFHRRFPVLIQNTLMNIPKNWAVQLVVNPTFWNEKVLPWHPGLPRLLQENQHRLFVTELPTRLQKIKQPNQRILLDQWFWQNLMADKVLLFSGNGIFCTHGNTPTNWNTLTQDVDYVGTPWTRFGKIGGDGATHSYRNRNLMLQALQYATTNNIKMEPPESIAFVSILQKMQQDTKFAAKPQIRLATREQTIMFGGVQTTNSTLQGHLRPIPPPPMVVSGTQAQLTFQQREDLLLVCPELKVIFPSLHEPSCFGAHPNPEGCKATICALRDPLPSSGC